MMGSDLIAIPEGELMLTLLDTDRLYLRERVGEAGLAVRVDVDGFVREEHLEALRSYATLRTDLKIIRLDQETQDRLRMLLKLKPDYVDLRALLAKYLEQANV
jgi:hypothetical protein